MKLRWRRGIAALLSTVMLLSMPGGLELTAAAVESAQETEQSAVQLVDNEYELTFTNSGRTVASYTGTPVDVTVPDGVTTIGGATFQNCQSLRSITLPASVTSISRYAFDSCSNLQTVTFATRDTKTELEIDIGAFQNCTSLASFTYPENAAGIIWNNAFSGCTALRSATLSSGLTKIYNGAFSGCTSLDSLSLPDTLTNIGEAAFQNCVALETLELPASVTNLGENVFSGCSGLVSVEHTGTRTQTATIGEGVFSGCSSLRSFTYPVGFASTVAVKTFEGCTSLERVVLAEGILGVEGSAFKDCTSLAEVVLPDSLTTIYARAFYGCTALTAIQLPSNLTTIYVAAFQGCTKLETVVLPDSVETLGPNVFSGCTALESVAFGSGLKTIGDTVFSDCSSLKHVSLPSGVTDWGTNIFQNSGLTTVTLPEDMTAIPGQLFMYSTALESVTIPDGVQSIGYLAFAGCKALCDVDIPDSVTSIDYEAFSSCPSLTQITLPPELTTISSRLFSNSGLIRIQIPDQVTSIERYAFSNCKALTSIVIPPSVATIDSYTFSGCNPANIAIWCAADSRAYTFAQEYGHPIHLLGTEDTRKVDATVQSPEGTVLTEGFTVGWYDISTGQQVAVGASAILPDASKTYECRISLGDELSRLYKTPEPQTVEPEDSGALVFSLNAYTAVRLSGTVVDETGGPIQGATVEIAQVFGEQSINLQPLTTEQDGGFSAEISQVPTTVVVRADGYYSARRTVSMGSSYVLGEIDLTKTVSDCIQLTLAQVDAVRSGETPQKRYLPNAAGLKFTLTRDELPVTGFEVQGTTLRFLPGVVDAGDTIQLSVQDTQGNYTAKDVSVTLDESKMGNAQITLTEHGKFYLPTISAAHAVDVMIFDEEGNLVSAKDVQCPMESDALPAGQYSLVFLEKTALLPSVPAISRLNELGLTEGNDYTLLPVTIADGIMTQLEPVTVPELNTDILTGRILDSGGLNVTPGQVTIGELAYLRMAFTLKGDAVAKNIQLSMPEGVESVGAAVLGVEALVTVPNGNTVTIALPEGVSEGVVYLACKVGKVGEHHISALLSTGEQILPLGGTALTLSPGRISLPTKTGNQTIQITGRTFPNATVTLYDNDLEIGTATTNAVGSWQGMFDLAEPLYASSYHYIHGVVTAAGLDQPAEIDSQLVIYDKDMPAVLETVTMYNTGDNGENKSVFHFGSADQTAQDTHSYRMWLGNFPTFTFQVEFSGDNTQLDQVYVVTESKSGHRTYVETAYDAGSGRWLGTQQYYAFEDAPQGIGVIYSFKESDDFGVQEEMFQDNMFSFVTSDTQPLADLIGTEIDGEKNDNAPLTFEVQKASELENDLQGVLKITENDEPLFWYRLQQTPENRTAQQLAAAGFYPVNMEQTLYTLASYREDAIQMQYADLTEHILLTETYYFEDPQAAAATARAQFISLADTRGIPAEVMDSIFDAYGKITDKLTLAGITKDLIELTDAQIQWRMQIQGNVDVLLIDANALGKVLDAKCPDGSDRLDADTQMQMASELIEIGQDIQTYQDTATSRATGAAVSKLMSIIGEQLFEKAFDKIPFASKMAKYKATIMKDLLQQVTEIGKQYFTPEIENALVNGIKLQNGTTIPIDQLTPALYTPASVENYINSTAAGLQKRLVALNTSFKNTKCEDKEPEEDDQTGKGDSSENYTDWGYSVDSVESEIKETIPILDPSGYVYEAVPSNRLTGVMATLYYQNETGSESLWNADTYSQLNPQITKADGAYAWFVPEGQWKVKFTKDGYLSADSSGVPAAVGNTGNTGWLPVPPPQFGVNIGMVSTAAPTVENTIAYIDRIEVTFSQYMNIGSVADAISLNRDGENISVTVKALDAEYNLEGTNQYATRFAVAPVDGDCAGTLTIATDAGNYANACLENIYTAALATPIQRPTAITAEDCALTVHEEGVLPVTLVNGAAGTALTVENLTPSLLSLSDQSVTAGADGTAALTLTGNLPGVGQIRVTEPVSGLSETFQVSIAMTETNVQDGKPEPVVATLSDGTVVTTGMTLEQGTRITLSTTTKGATIRYTLNDTCPCKDEALTYTGPIAITANTTLRAAAVLDGVYSDTIRLELMIKAEQSGGGTGGGGSNSVNYAVETADTEHGTITVTPSRAKTGDTVTIAVKPDAGYVLRTLTVADGKGNDVKLIDVDSRTYRFTMPDSAVLVNAVFAQELEMLIAFTDVDAEDYFYDAVAWAVAHNVTFGTSDTTFSPDNVCTRAQAVMFLWRAAGSPQPQMIINPFEDVQESDYFYNAVLWSVENNITAGTSAGTFSPDTVCTRSQAVTFLYRYDGTVATEMTEFIDVNETAYYYDAVQWAAQNGITSGTGTNTFSPEANCTRAQIVTFLYRALKK